MDQKTRNFWASFVEKELKKTKNDGEKYSFLLRTEGSIDFMYCPYELVEEWEFDGELRGLKLPWSSNRVSEIMNESANLTETELREWRRAKCRALAKEPEWCGFAWPRPSRYRCGHQGTA